MPLIPEKGTSRRGVRTAISSQFWEQPVASVRSLDGLCYNQPGEPPPLSQLAGSGVVRAQQLIVGRAAGVAVLPGYDLASGGLVLDGNLVKTGGETWWTALLGRAKIQRIWGGHRDGNRLIDAVRSSQEYAACARGRVAISRSTTVNGLLEAPSLADIQAALPGGREGRDPATINPLKGRVWAKQDIPGHHLIATGARNQEYLDRHGVYHAVPSTLSFDFASKDRQDGIQYRLGVHKAARSAADDELDADVTSQASGHSLHLMGAVAVEGEAMLVAPPMAGGAATGQDMKPDGVAGAQLPSMQSQAGHGPSKMDRASESKPAPASATPLDAAIPQSGDESMTADSKKSSGVLPGGSAQAWHRRSGQQASTSGGVSSMRGSDDLLRRIGREEDHRAPVGVWPPLWYRGGQPHGPASASLHAAQNALQPAKPRNPAGAAEGGSPGQSEQPVARKHVRWQAVRGSSSSSSDSDREDGTAQAGDSGQMSSGSSEPAASAHRQSMANDILTGLSQAQAAMDELQKVVKQAVGAVQEGHLAAGMRNGKSKATGNSPAGKVRRPYSIFLTQPHLKVNGAVGCLARIPLPSRAFQVGRFTRPFMDFTSGAIRLDLGLTSTDEAGAASPATASPSADDAPSTPHRRSRFVC
ncbi:hypothetical protein WJX84_000719 [Apatococcus fuscideae]|uniref:Uncharacterized protein n=1 Tax=Apatococcus fuscideae TaxID=2026836 RepID=A0AAW1TEF2_9CHLO